MSSAVGGAPAASARPRRKWIALTALLFAAFLLRAAVVFAPPSDVFEKEQVNQEELLRGIAAQEFLEGPVAPFFEYQVNHFWGGSLVVSVVAVPFYAVFGSRIVALRLVGVLFALVAVYCAFRLLDRFAGRTAAWIGALMLALSPPGYTYLSCMVFGTHMESNAFALLLACLYFEWRAAERGGWLRTAFLGLASGFALWFGYGLLLVLLLVAVFEWFEDPWFFARKHALPWVAGFAIGFTPWILYGIECGFRGFEVYEAGILDHFVHGLKYGTAVDMNGVVRFSVFEKAARMFEVDYPEALWFHESLSIQALDIGRAATLAILATVLSVGWRARKQFAVVVSHVVMRVFGRAPSSRLRADARDLGLFAFAFTVLFFVAYVATDFAIGPRNFVLNFRYLMPIWPFVAVCLGIGLAKLIEARGFVRIAAIVGVLSFSALSTASTLDRCRPETIAANWERPGSSPIWFARLVMLHFGTDVEKMTRVIQNIEEKRTREEQATLFRYIGKGLATYGKGDSDNLNEKARNVLYRRTLAALEARAKPEHRAFFSPTVASPLPR
ncbi:MAG: glycosyltransferase family 39 protein [Planctomycetota bacterium]|nr:glycosyltransferase family 39 protein [Planctomycetota bacterium]